MALRLGVAVFTYLVITESTAEKLLHSLDKLHVTTPMEKPVKQSLSSPRFIEIEEETARMYMETMKTALTRLIKSYRAVKPEVKVAMCFSRYAGIIEGERSDGRALKTEMEEEDEMAVKNLLRDIVHAIKLFMSDITPEPVLRIMKTASEMLYTTRNMYKTVKMDEMGSCSLEYMSKRFWWWLGI